MIRRLLLSLIRRCGLPVGVQGPPGPRGPYLTREAAPGGDFAPGDPTSPTSPGAHASHGPRSRVGGAHVWALVFLICTGFAQAARGQAGVAAPTPGYSLPAAPIFVYNGSSWVPATSGAPLNVSCVSGCSASGAFSDNSAFTVGTSAISPIGAYFTSGADPSITTGDAGRVRMDAHSYLFVDCTVGCSGGTFNNNSDAVATSSINGQTAAWLYGFNGTTFDRLQVDSSKFLKVNCAAGCSGGSTTPSDAFTNPTTAGLQFDLLAGFNGTTWDRLRVDGSKDLLVAINAALPAGANAIGSITNTGFNVNNFPSTQAASCTAANCAINEAQINGVTPLMNNGVSGPGSQRMNLASDNTPIANWGQGATGSAVPSGAVYEAGNGSGNLTGKIVCDNTVIKNAFSTSGSTQIVAAPGSGKNTYICGFAVNGASTTANTVKLVYGTKTTTDCDTGASDLSIAVPIEAPSSVAPAGQNVAPPENVLWKTGATNNQVCANLSAAQSVNLQVWYTSF